MGKENRAERPEEVECRECGRKFKLLHKPHLIKHGYNSQAEYREAYEIFNEPLNSERLADVLRKNQLTPKKQAITDLMGAKWQSKRSEALNLLKETGLYTPRDISRATGIPLTTVQSAIQEGRLSAAQIRIQVMTDHGFVDGGDKYIYGVKLEDMLEFAKNHKPKYPGKKLD